MKNPGLFLSSLLLVAAAALIGIPADFAMAQVEEGKPAPELKLKTQDNQDWSLADRKGKGWTVVYFYPKADSPGCTTQACAFRATIEKIKGKDALLIGVSTDDQATQKAFHDKHKLNFDLLSDGEGTVASAWGIKVPLLGIAKRWTFILDKDLVVRSVEPNVDPAFDAKWTIDALEELQNPPKEGSEEDDK
jgi:peroxiredoxin Q/BCP